MQANKALLRILFGGYFPHSTHVPEMPGLCEHLKLSNTSQLENELLMQANHLRLQYQYLVSLVYMECKHECTRKQSQQLWVLTQECSTICFHIGP